MSESAAAVREEQAHLVVATDEKYAAPTAVTLRSVAMHGPASFSATILHDAVTAATRLLVERSLADLDVTIHWVDTSAFHVGATTESHLPVATYFRLQIADAVPTGTQRVVYLDVDVLVRQSLEPLFSLDLDGRALAAVRSIHYPYMATRGASDHWRTLGLDPRAPFFNAGVLVIDVPAWAEQEVAERALDYLRSEYCGRGADQEALNVALNGSWQQLDPVWNQQTPILEDTFGAHLVHAAAEIDRARTDPAVVHFMTRPKPWEFGCNHPFTAEWWAVANETAFAPIAKMRQSSRVEVARWRVKRAASALIKGR